MKEEARRKDMQQEHDIERLNHEFSRLIERLSYQVERANYLYDEMEFNRQLVSCSIWRLGYRNNFINRNVLTLQAGWLLVILKAERGLDTLKNYTHVEREVAHLIMRIRHVDMRAYEAVFRNYPEVQSIL